MESSAADENGLTHILLCRVILGKMEMIPAGSRQFQPSSTEFDSGVDNIVEPRRFTVWNAFMNSHIFPNYIISIQAPSVAGKQSQNFSFFLFFFSQFSDIFLIASCLWMKAVTDLRGD